MFCLRLRRTNAAADADSTRAPPLEVVAGVASESNSRITRLSGRVDSSMKGKLRRQLELEVMSQRARATAAQKALGEAAHDNRQLTLRVQVLEAELAALKLETGLNRTDRTPASETSPGDLTIEVKRLRLKLQHRGMELLGKTQQVQELQQQLEALKQAMASLEATLAQQHSPEQQVPEALASTATKVLQEHMQVQQVLPQLQEVQASQQQQPQQQEDDGGSQAQSEPAVHPPGQPQPQQQQGGGDLQPAPAVVARLQIQQQGGKAQSKTQQPHRSQKPQTQQQQHGSGSAKISLAASGIHPRQLQVHQDKAQALAQWKQPQLKQQQEQHGHVNVHTTLDASVLKPPRLCAEKPVPQVQQQQGVGTPKVHIPPAASKLAAPVSLLGQLQAQQPQQQQQPPSRSGSLKSQTFNRDAGATADHPRDSMLTASSRNGGLSRIHSAHVRELREWLEKTNFGTDAVKQG